MELLLDIEMTVDRYKTNDDRSTVRIEMILTNINNKDINVCVTRATALVEA